MYLWNMWRNPQRLSWLRGVLEMLGSYGSWPKSICAMLTGLCIIVCSFCFVNFCLVVLALSWMWHCHAQLAFSFTMALPISRSVELCEHIIAWQYELYLPIHGCIGMRKMQSIHKFSHGWCIKPCMLRMWKVGCKTVVIYDWIRHYMIVFTMK